ncbi:hypothetical protein EDB83DRAFT_2313521 [Lactarius deliciosus]|nr:hypothetical protein EDB83DRAFT_2313521 [Lactarius deliciosus]
MPFNPMCQLAVGLSSRGETPLLVARTGLRARIWYSTSEVSLTSRNGGDDCAAYGICAQDCRLVHSVKKRFPKEAVSGWIDKKKRRFQVQIWSNRQTTGAKPELSAQRRYQDSAHWLIEERVDLARVHLFSKAPEFRYEEWEGNIQDWFAVHQLPLLASISIRMSGEADMLLPRFLTSSNIVKWSNNGSGLLTCPWFDMLITGVRLARFINLNTGRAEDRWDGPRYAFVVLAFDQSERLFDQQRRDKRRVETRIFFPVVKLVKTDNLPLRCHAGNRSEPKYYRQMNKEFSTTTRADDTGSDANLNAKRRRLRIELGKPQGRKIHGSE